MSDKLCTKCGETKPYSEFHRDKTRKDGRTPYCKTCKKEYYKENRETLIARSKQWQRDNWSRYLKYQREYQRKSYFLNPQRSRATGRARAREYYQRHKGEIAKKRKLRRERNKDKIRLRKLAAQNKRRAAKNNAPGNFTDNEFKQLCDYYENRCLRCGERNRLTADHVVPLSRGGANDITNIQPLCKPCNSIKHASIKDYRTKPFPKRWQQLDLFDD